MSFKTYTNSDIPLETSAIIFVANLDLKPGISSEYVMVDFICEVLLELRGTLIENYKIKNSCPQRDSNPVPFACESNALTIALLDLISIEHLNVYRVLPECAIKIYPNHLVDVVKCCVV